MNYLIKIFCPRMQPWERERIVNTTLIVLFATLLFGAGIAFALYWLNRPHG